MLRDAKTRDRTKALEPVVTSQVVLDMAELADEVHKLADRSSKAANGIGTPLAAVLAMSAAAAGRCRSRSLRGGGCRS